MNAHFHALVLDGAYSLDAAGKPQFHAVAAPDDEHVGEVAMRVYTRVARRGLPIRRLKTGQTPVARLLGKTCAEVE